jgi:hypothetical protein
MIQDVAIKQGNIDVDVVTSGSVYFLEHEDYRRIWIDNAGSYSPTGASYALTLTQNSIGHSCAGFRTDFIKLMGGWDATSRAMWEDWQLFLKCAVNNAKIMQIPKLTL